MDTHPHTNTHTDTHTHKKRQKMRPDVAAQLNPVGEWIISQSWAKKINFFSRTLGCFRIHTTFKTKPWDIYWQLQELSSLMFPLISSSCSKWRCGSGCHCSIVWCEIFSFSTNAGFFLETGGLDSAETHFWWSEGGSWAPEKMRWI